MTTLQRMTVELARRTLILSVIARSSVAVDGRVGELPTPRSIASHSCALRGFLHRDDGPGARPSISLPRS